MRRLLLAAALVSLAAACLEFPSSGRYKCDPSTHSDCVAEVADGGEGGDDEPDAGLLDAGGPGTDDAGVDGGMEPGDVVIVHRIATFIAPDGTITRVPLGAIGETPYNPVPQFWTVDASTGALDPVIPTDIGGGSFSVPIPAGSQYAWGFARVRHFSTERELDLGTDEQGRSDVAPPDGGSQLQVDVTLTRALDGTDGFRVVSPQSDETGALSPQTQMGTGNQLHATCDYRSASEGSISSAKGDHLFLEHFQTYIVPNAPNMSCTALFETLESTTTDVGITGTHAIMGGFNPANIQTRQLTFDSSAFLSLAQKIAPSASLEQVMIGVYPYSAPLDFGWVGYLGEELQCTVSAATGQIQKDLPVQYGEAPFRKGGFASFGVNYQYSMGMPDNSTAGGNAPWSMIVPEDELFSMSTFPELMPVSSATIDGIDFSAPGPNQLSDPAPVVQWKPPSPTTRTAQSYTLSIYEFSKGGDGSWNAPLLASLATTGTQVRIPPGMLKSGRIYTFILFAEASDKGGFDPVHAPLRNYARVWRAPLASRAFIAK